MLSSLLNFNKSSGCDEISFNVLKKCFRCEPLRHVFSLFIEIGVFPDKLKITRVSPVYKAGDSSDLNNYKLISVLSCFPRILEIIMNNRLFSYVSQ